MSQNTLTLQLFFEDPIKLKLGQLVYQYLAAGNTEQAQRWADKLGGADLDALWDAEWFNQEVFAEPNRLTLRFDTGTTDDLPLRALEALFSHGLQAAVLEVFYDQVGETERMHFDAGQWVSRQAFFQKNPQWQPVVEPKAKRGEKGESSGDEEDEEDADYACSKDPAKPISITKLRKQEVERKREAQEAVEAIVDFAKAMGKSGTSPVKGLIAVLLLRAGLKGLLQAFVFTVVTVLLFKGFWLWLGLGLVLAVVLPLYYMLSEYKDLKGDDDDDNETDGDKNNNNNGSNDDDGSPATVMARG